MFCGHDPFFDDVLVVFRVGFSRFRFLLERMQDIDAFSQAEQENEPVGVRIVILADLVHARAILGKRLHGIRHAPALDFIQVMSQDILDVRGE